VIEREQRGDYLIGCWYLCSQWLKESEEGTIWAKLCRWVSPSLICLALVLCVPTLVLCVLIWTRLSSCMSSWWYSDKIEQVVPHITDCIQDWIERVARVPVDGLAGTADVCVIELGGTVGDIESMPFIEALRQFQFRVGRDNFCLVHVSLVPVLGVVGEQVRHTFWGQFLMLRSDWCLKQEWCLFTFGELNVDRKQNLLSIVCESSGHMVWHRICSPVAVLK
jgi:hypothetical protein